MKFSPSHFFALLFVLIVLGVSAGAASAAVQVGQKCATPDGGPPVTFQRSIASGESFVVPSNGIITKWGTNRTGLSGLQLAAATIGTWTGTQWTVVSSAPFVDVPVGVASEYPVRLPVSAGQTLGSVSFNSNASMCQTGDLGDTVDYDVNYQAAGASFIPSGPIFSYRANIWASLEADIDKDGYGDETQDKCPQSAALQAACPVLVVSQRLKATKGAIAITAAASVDTSLTTTAKVKLPKRGKKKARTVTFSAGPKEFKAGQLTRLSLKLPSSVKSALAAVKKSKKLKFTVTLTGSGLANTATSTGSISLPGTLK